MKPSAARKAMLRSVAMHCDAIKALVPWPAMVTVIVRDYDADPQRDICVTSDDLVEVAAAVERARERDTSR